MTTSLDPMLVDLWLVNHAARQLEVHAFALLETLEKKVAMLRVPHYYISPIWFLYGYATSHLFFDYIYQ